MSDISKYIQSIETSEEVTETPAPTRKSSLGLQPIDEQRKPAPQRLQTASINSLETSSYENPRWITKVTIASIVFWLLVSALIAFFVLKIDGSSQSIPTVQWAGLSVMVIGPLVFIGIAYYAMRQLVRVSNQANHLQHMAERLSQPDQLIAQNSETLAGSIAEHVDLINAKLNEGVGRISSLDEVLRNQAASIDKSNRDSAISAQSIDQHIQAQKSAFETIAQTYDQRMGALSEMMDTHAENLTTATRLAEQKIKEARISVEGATAKINSASDIVRANTVQAASTLSGSHDEIKTLGDIIKQRSDELDGVYKKHANDLTAMIEHLRDEQQNLGANMEDTLVKMRDLSLSAQASAESLSDASSAGKETIQALAQSASLADDAVKTRFAEMEQMVRYSTEHAQNINTVASQRVQDSLEQTRTEIARIERDMAGLQDKLQKSAAVREQEEQIAETNMRRSQPERQPRVHLKPIEYAETDDAQTSIELPEIDSSESDVEMQIAAAQSQEEHAPLDLHIEEPDVEELKQGLVSSDPILAAIRPAAEYETNKKSKSGFSLRGLFGGKSDDDEASLSIASAGTSPAGQSSESKNIDRNFVRTLTEMGLSPNVIVDDGCVIEAANNRAAQGHEAMSRAVIKRLSVPVKHFAATLSEDADLSTRAINFASTFDLEVEKRSDDREAIRTRLESEAGRAYLICDAALNYGRV